MIEQTFSHLGATGVVGAEKEDAFFHALNISALADKSSHKMTYPWEEASLPRISGAAGGFASGEFGERFTVSKSLGKSTDIPLEGFKQFPAHLATLAA
jgi:hypothetical protein